MAKQTFEQKRRFDIEPLYSQMRLEYIQSLIHQAVSGDQTSKQIAKRIDLMFDRIIQIDNFTKLDNLLGLQSALELAMDFARQSGTPLTLLYEDGDQFKRINDELGHEVGNMIIQEIANGNRRALKRSSDWAAHVEYSNSQVGTIARQGGDEFAVVLPGTPLEGAAVVVKRIEDEVTRAVKRAVPNYKRHFKKDFTITIGMVEFDRKIDTNWREFLHRADFDMQRLKREKKQARD